MLGPWRSRPGATGQGSICSWSPIAGAGALTLCLANGVDGAVARGPGLRLRGRGGVRRLHHRGQEGQPAAGGPGRAGAGARHHGRDPDPLGIALPNRGWSPRARHPGARRSDGDPDPVQPRGHRAADPADGHVRAATRLRAGGRGPRGRGVRGDPQRPAAWWASPLSSSRRREVSVPEVGCAEWVPTLGHGRPEGSGALPGPVVLGAVRAGDRGAGRAHAGASRQAGRSLPARATTATSSSSSAQAPWPSPPRIATCASSVRGDYLGEIAILFGGRARRRPRWRNPPPCSSSARPISSPC